MIGCVGQAEKTDGRVVPAPIVVAGPAAAPGAFSASGSPPGAAGSGWSREGMSDGLWMAAPC